MTSFAKKELEVAFLCVSLGVLALSYPFFVSASGIIAPQTLPYTYEGNSYEEATSYFLPSYNDTHIVYCEDNENLIIKAGKNLGFVWSCGSGEPHKKALWIYCPNGVCGTPVYSEAGLGLNTLNPPYSTCFTSDIILTSQNLLASYTEDWGGQNCLNAVSQNDIILEANFVSPPICELGNCALCTDFSNCINAGCQWFYEPRLYPPLNYCDEPEGALECGDYQHCPYCLTQEECALKEECIWSDLATGEKCHWQIYVPPVEVTYPACEMDDCDPLSLPEKWVCMLKNAMTGIFCPSEETVDNLKNSIDVLNEKFPFNYVEAVKQFVVDIKTSLATPKTITLTMFGASGSLNFDFLDMPITIGGQEETMGDIFIFVTSAFIYIAFFFWLLQFIRRFF